MAAKRTPKVPDPITLFADRLIAQLQTQRQKGDYPLSLRQLLAEAGVATQATTEQIAAVIKKPAFSKQTLLVLSPDAKKTISLDTILQSPVGLLEDAGRLAAEASVVKFARRLLPGRSVADVIKLVHKDKTFRGELEASLRSELAGELVKILRSRRSLGEPSYPMTIEELATSAGNLDVIDVLLALAVKANKAEFLVSATIPEKITAASAKNLGTALVVLHDDQECLAGSARLLEQGLRSCQTRDNRAFPLKDIAKKLFKVKKGEREPAIKDRFVSIVSRNLALGNAPGQVGWVIKKEPLLFLLSDFFPNSARQKLLSTPNDRQNTLPIPEKAQNNPVTTVASAPAGSPNWPLFAQRFDEEFRRIDLEMGGYNFVSIYELRKALHDFPREAFELGLKELRRNHRYRINVGEARSGIPVEQQQAAIVEDGAIHTSVSKVKS
jgi:hypothetical protein